MGNQNKIITWITGLFPPYMEMNYVFLYFNIILKELSVEISIHFNHCWFQ